MNPNLSAVRVADVVIYGEKVLDDRANSYKSLEMTNLAEIFHFSNLPRFFRNFPAKFTSCSRSPTPPRKLPLHSKGCVNYSAGDHKHCQARV